MNINLSQRLRAINCFFFIFTLFFSGIAQASVFQKMNGSFLGFSQSKVKEVFSILDDLDVTPMSLSRKQMRVLVRALDDPTDLLTHFPLGLSASQALLYQSRGIGSHANPTLRFYRILQHFLFSRFDLHKHSDALFTKLFSKKRGRKWEELPFEEAKKNWENFSGAVEIANRFFGYARIRKIDLEAAAMSFIHRRFSDKYFPHGYAYYGGVYYAFTNPRSWDEESLGTFFNNQFNVSHYISPHFTLTPENPYHYPIMNGVLKHSFLREGENFSLINSKEFVLRIWSDVNEEINRLGKPGVSGFVFLQRIVASIFELRMSPDSSMGAHDFLKAMEEAAREDDRLIQLVNIVKNFVSSSNLESYRQILLEQLGEMSELDRFIISDLLDYIDREDFILQFLQRNSDPADAGAHL